MAKTFSFSSTHFPNRCINTINIRWANIDNSYSKGNRIWTKIYLYQSCFLLHNGFKCCVLWILQCILHIIHVSGEGGLSLPICRRSLFQNKLQAWQPQRHIFQNTIQCKKICFIWFQISVSLVPTCQSSLTSIASLVKGYYCILHLCGIIPGQSTFSESTIYGPLIIKALLSLAKLLPIHSWQYNKAAKMTFVHTSVVLVKFVLINNIADTTNPILS